MNLKKNLFTLILGLALIIPSLALAINSKDVKNNTKAFKEIKELIHDIEFNVESMEEQTVKVHFMINTSNEVVVLRTSSEDVDQVIKYKLNYKLLESTDLEVNQVYILPITFQK